MSAADRTRVRAIKIELRRNAHRLAAIDRIMLIEHRHGNRPCPLQRMLLVNARAERRAKGTQP
jgi:hypothetical protein